MGALAVWDGDIGGVGYQRPKKFQSTGLFFAANQRAENESESESESETESESESEK